MEQILVVFFKYVMRIEPMAFDPHLPKKKKLLCGSGIAKCEQHVTV